MANPCAVNNTYIVHRTERERERGGGGGGGGWRQIFKTSPTFTVLQTFPNVNDEYILDVYPNMLSAKHIVTQAGCIPLQIDSKLIQTGRGGRNGASMSVSAGTQQENKHHTSSKCNVAGKEVVLHNSLTNRYTPSLVSSKPK